MKKKIIAVLSSIVFMLISFTNLSVSAENSSKYTCNYMYNMLDTAIEREFYNGLYQSCYYVDMSEEDFEIIPFVSEPSNTTYEEILEIMNIFVYDHPEFYWLDETIYYNSEQGYTIGVMQDFTDGTSRQSVKEHIEREKQDYIDIALSYNTDYERVKYIHDRLLYEATYEMNDWDQSIVSVFLSKKTVCAGYSKAFSYLCNAIGIDTICVLGYNHAWNKVKLDGFWYNVDVTNDHSSYDYFLISDSRLSQTDYQSGTTYTMRYLEENKIVELEFYLHDLDLQTYVNYYNQLPDSPISYDELAYMTPTYITGDANNDGIVNVRDCSFIALMLSQSRADILAEHSDFNLDSKVNVRDAAAIAIALASGSL